MIPQAGAEVSPGTVVWHVANDDRAALGELGSQLAALANDSAALKAAAWRRGPLVSWLAE